MSDDREDMFELWTETLPRVLGIDGFLENFSVPEKYRPYVFLFGIFAIDLFILLFYLVRDSAPTISLPWVVIPIAITLALAAATDLRGRQAYVVGKYYRNGKEDDIEDFTPLWLRVVILVTVLVGWLVYLLIRPEDVREFYGMRGPVSATVQLFIFVPIYMFVVSDFVATVAGSTILIPVVLFRRGVPVNFSDPFGYGGLRPFGKLVERAALYYFGAVLLYSIRLFQQPGTLIFEAPSGARLTVFSVAWLFGFVAYLAPTLSLYFLLKRHKERKIRELNQEIYRLGNDELGLPGKDPGEDEVECILRELEIQRVRNSGKVPISTSKIVFTALSSLVLRAVEYLPEVVDISPVG